MLQLVVGALSVLPLILVYLSQGVVPRVCAHNKKLRAHSHQHQGGMAHRHCAALFRSWQFSNGRSPESSGAFVCQARKEEKDGIACAASRYAVNIDLALVYIGPYVMTDLKCILASIYQILKAPKAASIAVSIASENRRNRGHRSDQAECITAKQEVSRLGLLDCWFSGCRTIQSWLLCAPSMESNTFAATHRAIACMAWP